MTTARVIPGPERLRGDGTRAAYPDTTGHVERDGVRTYYEVYGHGEPTLFFLPTWSLVHSRIWKAQIAYFARHYRVLVMDGRGNGRSDRPLASEAYQPWEFAGDALAVMDATGTDRAVLVSTSMGTFWNLLISAGNPERVVASCLTGPVYPLRDPFPDWSHTPFYEELENHDGPNHYNRHFIRDHYAEFATWWAEMCLQERHSTRPLEFTLDMALDTTPEVIIATIDAGLLLGGHGSMAEVLSASAAPLREAVRMVRCPALVIEGAHELITPPHWAAALADDIGGELFMIGDAGHVPQARRPVSFNLKLRSFVERVSAGA